MLGLVKFAKRYLIALLILAAGIGSATLFSLRSASGSESRDRVIAEGAGTTIIHGGTGPSGGFVPVLTTIAFHVDRSGGRVAGSFECLAMMPEESTGSKSAQFTMNVMYVTGQITGATVHGDTATLTGTADITGLGAGSNVNFTFAVRNGGPGATAVLTASGLTFHELLVQGAFEVRDQD